MSRTLEYTEAPSFWPIYRRVLFGRRATFKPGGKLPALRAQWRGAQANPEKVAAYREACGLPKGDTLPLLYPHVLTSGLHLDIMSQPDFPVSLLGAVHARQHVLRYRGIRVEETFDALCAVAGQRVIKAGLEFDVSTVLTSASGERIYESLSTYLARGKKFGEAGESPALARLPELSGGTECGTWRVPPNMGRRYARITGDFNPIHISNPTARLFGFPRAIIHGMWSAARSLAELKAGEEGAPVRCGILFKGPVFIGSQVSLQQAAADGGTRFDLFAAGNDRPVLQGEVRPPHEGESLA